MGARAKAGKDGRTDGTMVAAEDLVVHLHESVHARLVHNGD